MHLHGKSYFVMHGLGSNNAFDTYLLPKDLLLDGATVDLGVYFDMSRTVALDPCALHVIHVTSQCSAPCATTCARRVQQQRWQ